MPDYVTPKLFIETWMDTWRKESPNLKQQWIEDYNIDSRNKDKSDNYKTTTFILGNEKQQGFLDRVGANLKKDPIKLITDCKRDNDQLNFKYYREEFISVALEYEPGDDVEVKMQDLCMLRAPLKVLVFYDWDEEDIKERKSRKTWLGTTLQTLCDIRERFDAAWGENSGTRYLLIVGDRKGEDHDTKWRYGCVSPELKEKDLILMEPRC